MGREFFRRESTVAERGFIRRKVRVFKDGYIGGSVELKTALKVLYRGEERIGAPISRRNLQSELYLDPFDTKLCLCSEFERRVDVVVVGYEEVVLLVPNPETSTGDRLEISKIVPNIHEKLTNSKENAWLYTAHRFTSMPTSI